MFSQIVAMRRSIRCAGHLPMYRRVLGSTSAYVAVALLAPHHAPAQTARGVQTAQNNGQLPEINVQVPRKKRAPVSSERPTGQPQPGAAPPTPLNGNAVATSSSRLGLTVRETPASVDVVADRRCRTGAIGPALKSPRAQSVYWTSTLPERRPISRCEVSPLGHTPLVPTSFAGTNYRTHPAFGMSATMRRVCGSTITN
jgi:hypothetical protein